MFQALPIAFRKNTGDPTSKLVFTYLVLKCDLPPPDAYADTKSALLTPDPDEVASWCQISRARLFEALEHLERLGLVKADGPWASDPPYTAPTDPAEKWEFLSVTLPLSLKDDPADRRRLKASPDQLALLVREADYRCPGCGAHEEDIKSWHVDHVIPRARGGADVEENCQPLCDRCNGRKHTRLGWIDFLGDRQ